MKSLVVRTQVVVYTRSGPVVVDKSIGVAVGAVTGAAFGCEIAQELVYLADIFALCQRRVLDDGAPAIGI